MATADKLTYLSQTKSDIRDAIIAKGVSVPAATTFRDYVTKVGEISTGDPSKSKAYDYAERVSIDGGNVENITAVKILETTNTLLSFIPSGKKAGKAYSITPIDGTGDFTVDRNSTATYVDKNGVIQTAVANTPKFDFSEGSAALSVEPQATNLLPYSEDFANANWSTVACTKTLVSENNPLDTNAYEIKCNANSASRIYYNGIAETGKNYSTLLLVKPSVNNPDYLGIAIISNTQVEVFYNFNTDSFEEGASTGAAANCESISLSDGWKLLKINISENAVNTRFNIYQGTRVANTLTGVIGQSYFIKAAQVEQASVSTSYIPTSGSTVTRLKDTITINPSTGTTSITETIDNITQTPITTIPATYTVPNGNINKVIMQ